MTENKKSKQKPEDVISEYLNGDNKKNALIFVDWLRKNKLSPQWVSIRAWNVVCRRKSICTFTISGPGDSAGNWNIRPRLENKETYKEVIMNEGLQDIIWNSGGYCVYSERSPYYGAAKAPGCSPDKSCRGGREEIVLGKIFKNVCHFGAGLINPDEITVSGVKQLLELEKNAIMDKN
jgi:hypothetical protein